MRIKPLPKLALVILFAGGAFYGIRTAIQRGYIPSPTQAASTVPPKAELPVARPKKADAPSMIPPPAPLPALPVAARAVAAGVRMEIWAWNAQTGVIFANGGASTAPGSLMAARGVALTLKRQDDVPQMQNDLLAFAQALKSGDPQPSVGTHFVVIMGDGAATFLAGLNEQLGRLGGDYIAEIVGSFGYSVGEDKFMGLPAWKADPQAARGALIAGVLRDGDWNIALKWAADNGIPNNPDETSYDPHALNWVAADTYIDAAQKYVAGYCENRSVKGGQSTARQCVNGVVTWTPGDVTVAKERGGLVSIVSTREYRWQMPSVAIGIRKWNQANRATIENLLAAAFDGAERVKRDDATLRKATALNAQVFGEESADYWYRYFKGVTEQDKQGLDVELGGSSVNTLADAAQLFGLDEGGTDIMSAVYRVFGDIVVAQYPALVPSYPPPSSVIDTSYIRALLERARREQAPIPAPERPEFQPVPVKNVVSRRAWSINFDTGKATFRPEAEATLQQLFDQLTVAGGLAVEIHGHTDNTGTPVRNQTLSEARAFAVRDWLRTHAPTAFPDARVRVAAHGQTQPVAANDTETGRSQNRRVEIVLGVTS